jgi:hypothetical protein
VLVEGMSWRRFTALVASLDGDSVWRWWRRQKNQVLEGEAAQAYFTSL